MREMKENYVIRRAGILITVCLLCIGLLFSCGKKTAEERIVLIV